MNHLSLFTGAGGGELGAILNGWHTVGYVEWDDYCQRVLAQRIRDGILPEAPIFSDVRAFISEGYAEAYQGMVDVISAGFPCQPFSVAGQCRAEDDPRNMWPATIECLRIIRPQYALLENVPGLLVQPYIRRIFGDLAAAGYDTAWKTVPAEILGAPIVRERLFIVARADRSDGEAWVGNLLNRARKVQHGPDKERNEFWLQGPSPDIGVGNGLAGYLERVRAIGNGQVPAVVRTVWNLLMQPDSQVLDQNGGDDG